MPQHEIKLGQRVYGVTKQGHIIPTLISQIELPEAHENESELVRRASESLHGRLHEAISGIPFRALNHHLDPVWLTFDEAYDQALAVLEKLKDDESISVRDQRDYIARYEWLVAHKEDARAEVEDVQVFTESDTMITRMGDRDEKDRRFTASDFPQRYIDLGTPVWIADTKNWRLIRGFVTEVHFAPRWPRKHVYHCGSHANLRADRVFRTKKGALNCLARAFAAELPGTLDRDRVPIVKQISRAEEIERKFKMADRMIGTDTS